MPKVKNMREVERDVKAVNIRIFIRVDLYAVFCYSFLFHYIRSPSVCFFVRDKKVGIF